MLMCDFFAVDNILVDLLIILTLQYRVVDVYCRLRPLSAVLWVIFV